MHPPADNVDLQRTPRIDMMDKGNSGTSVPLSGASRSKEGPRKVRMEKMEEAKDVT
jgi:hypothetical protein